VHGMAIAGASHNHTSTLVAGEISNSKGMLRVPTLAGSELLPQRSERVAGQAPNPNALGRSI